VSGLSRDELERLAEHLGHRFQQLPLLETALAHPSYSFEVDGSRGNERLEFLGDAVLDLVVAQMLYATHPDWSEGDLTRARASLVNTASLAERARELELGRHVRLGRTERRSGGAEKESILANALEAVVGAAYLDAGLGPIFRLAERLFGAAVREGEAVRARDPKTAFQEWAHAERRATPRYRLCGDNGVEDAGDRFRVAVEVGGEVWGEGCGRTKRAAERAAARRALERAREP